jgi:hypothetical protein
MYTATTTTSQARVSDARLTCALFLECHLPLSTCKTRKIKCVIMHYRDAVHGKSRDIAAQCLQLRAALERVCVYTVSGAKLLNFKAIQMQLYATNENVLFRVLFRVLFYTLCIS